MPSIVSVKSFFDKGFVLAAYILITIFTTVVLGHESVNGLLLVIEDHVFRHGCVLAHIQVDEPILVGELSLLAVNIHTHL